MIFLVIIFLIIVFFKIWRYVAKKPLGRKMIFYVDNFKILLYTILEKEIVKKHKNYTQDEAGNLAATIVNEIFDCHEHKTKNFIIKNKDLVNDEMVSFGKNYSNLRQYITDAVRVHHQANYMLTGKINENFHKATRNLKNKGLFIEGGIRPSPNKFPKDVKKLCLKYTNKEFMFINYPKAPNGGLG